MDVWDFVNLCIDTGLLRVDIYSFEAGNVIWSGYACELPEEIGWCEIASFDVPTRPDHITINIGD